MLHYSDNFKISNYKIAMERLKKIEELKLKISEIKDYLEKTGAVESGYRTKTQMGGGPARSYWQVEPATAMDLVKNSSAYFGPKFRKIFGEDALKTLQGLNEQQMADLLLKNDTLAATMAAAVWIRSSW